MLESAGRFVVLRILCTGDTDRCSYRRRSSCQERPAFHPHGPHCGCFGARWLGRGECFHEEFTRGLLAGPVSGGWCFLGPCRLGGFCLKEIWALVAHARPATWGNARGRCTPRSCGRVGLVGNCFGREVMGFPGAALSKSRPDVILAFWRTGANTRSKTRILPKNLGPLVTFAAELSGASKWSLQRLRGRVKHQP